MTKNLLLVKLRFQSCASQITNLEKLGKTRNVHVSAQEARSVVTDQTQEGVILQRRKVSDEIATS